MSTQKQSTNCTNSTNSPISEIREISGCAQKTIGEIREISEPSPKISVIVPVYKVEKYLPECIESVLAQTFMDFELILVDDGSPDNSGAICDAYAARDPRIRVFHKQNGGVTSARRLGVERSRGEWISFVDSDDKLFPNALRDLTIAAEVHPDADLIEGKDIRENIFEDNETSPKYMKASNLEYAIELASYTERIWTPAPFAKIIRKNLIFSSHAMETPAKFRWGEDFLMCVRLSVKMKKAVKIFTPIYFYRRNPESVCASFQFTTSYCEELLYELERIIPGGLAGKFSDVWGKVARRFFVTVFLCSSDWGKNSRTEYWGKVKYILRENFKSFPIGTKLCLIFSSLPFQKITRKILSKALNLSLRLKSTKTRRI